MPEPHSTAIGIAVGAGIGLTGSIFGAQADSLLIGLIAAILISFWLPTIDDRRKATASVALSSLLAGYGSPVVAAWLAGTQTAMPESAEMSRLLALLIGVFCPTIVPVALGWAKRKVEAQ